MRTSLLLLCLAVFVGCGPALSEPDLGEVIYELPAVGDSTPLAPPPQALHDHAPHAHHDHGH